MNKIRYVSTNQKSKPVSFREALLNGQAPDKGLYMPSRIPKIHKEEIMRMGELPYSEIAFTVMNKFLKGEIPERDLRAMAEETYNYPVPLECLDNTRFIMRLDQGPTASFKDFAARMMARLMSYYLQQEGKELTILVATSGDTGGAVADAFLGMPNIKVVILMPKDEISERQRRQMTTLGENIAAILVQGKFDDCQALVKRALADPELMRLLNLSSANSINFGRLLPQSVYYFYAYAKLLGEGEIIFSVPSGNFGDMMGGMLAMRMGLPVRRFVIAVNENDEFPRFLSTGKYEPIKPSKACLSSAMNVGHPSNLARLIWLYGGRMDEKGIIRKRPDMKEMRRKISSYSITDMETKWTIRDVYSRYKTLLEPHGAVGCAALQRHTAENGKDRDRLAVILETAHPSKFPETIKELTNVEPEMTERMKEQAVRPELASELDVDYDSFKALLKISHAR